MQASKILVTGVAVLIAAALGVVHAQDRTKRDSTAEEQARLPVPQVELPPKPFKTAEEHYVIVTYWRSFEDHERSHANELFTKKFSALADMCAETKELGYDLLWQGQAEQR